MAMVKIVGADTGIIRTTSSNNSGYYSVSEIQPGRYLLTVRATGFETVSRTNILLQVAQAAEVDFVLPVGNSHAPVTVASTAGSVMSLTPSTDSTIDREHLNPYP